MDGFRIPCIGILLSLGLACTQSKLGAITEQQVKLIVEQALAKQDKPSNQQPLIILINDKEKSSESWTPTIIKAGLLIGAFYAFDYYILGGRVISHINKKTNEILAKIADLREYMKKRFDHVDKNMETLLKEIKKNNLESTTQLTKFYDDSTNPNKTTSQKTNTSWWDRVKFWQ